MHMILDAIVKLSPVPKANFDKQQTNPVLHTVRLKCSVTVDFVQAVELHSLLFLVMEPEQHDLNLTN